MKNSYLIIIAVFILGNLNAQNPILALGEHVQSEVEQGTYSKDVDNVFNNFEGTWVYNEGGIYLEIEFKKEEMFFNGFYYKDLLVGEILYKENGQTLINTLSNLNDPNIPINEHTVDGNLIFKDCVFMPVQDCIDGEKRVSLFMRDSLEDQIYYSLILHKRVINGQEALKVFINQESRKFTYLEGETLPEATISLQGEYTFLKQ